MTLVADTSALISLGCADQSTVLDLLFDGYDVVIPTAVLDELSEIATYDDRHGRAAETVLDRDGYAVHDVSPDPEFPLDQGENEVVALANEQQAAFCYCDEFNHLAIVHASLVESRLVTTPRLFEGFVGHRDLARAEAATILESIETARSCEDNAYVQQSKKWFTDSED